MMTGTRLKDAGPLAVGFWALGWACSWDLLYVPQLKLSCTNRTILGPYFGGPPHSSQAGSLQGQDVYLSTPNSQTPSPSILNPPQHPGPALLGAWDSGAPPPRAPQRSSGNGACRAAPALRGHSGPFVQGLAQGNWC